MLRIVTYYAFALIFLVNSVSCVYMQARNTKPNQTDSSPNQTNTSPNTSGKQDENNMKDIFKINETVEKTFPVSSKTTVKIYSFEGEITVKSENTSVVKMRATKMAVDKDASDGVKYNFSQTNGTINLQAEYTKPDRKVSYGKSYFYSKGAYVNWELVLPAETDLILETGEGKIFVQGVNGEIKLSTKDGSITVTDCKGNLDSTTFDGKVQISGYQGNAEVINRGDEPVLVEGDFQNLSVLTGGGNVFLGLAKSGGGTVEADTENISVKDFVLKQAGQNGNGWQKYSFGEGNSKIKIQSNTGKISIYPY